VVGKQAGREIRPYQTETGEELLLLQPGVRGAGEVFQTEHNNNRTATWIYRLAGWFVTFLGLSCLSTVLEILMDMFPSIRRLATMGMTSLSFSISITLTLSIIGLGWVWYRPLLGLCLLLVGLAPHCMSVGWLTLRGRRRVSLDRP